MIRRKVCLPDNPIPAHSPPFIHDLGGQLCSNLPMKSPLCNACHLCETSTCSHHVGGKPHYMLYIVHVAVEAALLRSLAFQRQLCATLLQTALFNNDVIYQYHAFVISVCVCVCVCACACVCVCESHFVDLQLACIMLCVCTKSKCKL